MTRSEAPETLEGWCIQHDMYTVKWSEWRAAAPAEREAAIAESADWLAAQAGEGGTELASQRLSAFFSVLGQKADILAVHFRPTLEALNGVELSLRQTALFSYLQPAYSYLSVVELGLYEVLGVVNRKLAAEGLEPGVEGYEAAREHELAAQKEALHPRLYPAVPNGRYVCFYPMDKKRGETYNWYALSMEERRQLMRGHGMVGRKYAGKVTQIISGSVGFDDWEWGVTLFADDPLLFKKLIYEMRFDPASSHYALFGGFYVGIRFEPSEVGVLLSGKPPA
jgi:chlorite dismutase